MGETLGQSIVHAGSAEEQSHVHPASDIVNSLIQFIRKIHDNILIGELPAWIHRGQTHTEAKESFALYKNAFASQTVTGSDTAPSKVQALQLPDSEKFSRLLLDYIGWQVAATSSGDTSSANSGTFQSGSTRATEVSLGEPSRVITTSRQPKRVDRDGDGNDDNGEPKKVKPGSSTKSARKKVACPFFKHNPQKFMNFKGGCCCNTWADVSRLKTDHLYRHHYLGGVQCPRCGEILSAQTLPTHISCDRVSFEEADGFDLFKMQELHSKKLARRQPKEEDKWHDVFSILFPGIPHPSPYLEVSRDVLVSFLQPLAEPVAQQLAQAASIEIGGPSAVGGHVVGDFQVAPGLQPTDTSTGLRPEPAAFLEEYGQARDEPPIDQYIDPGIINDSIGGLNPGTSAGEPLLDYPNLLSPFDWVFDTLGDMGPIRPDTQALDEQIDNLDENFDDDL
ncbi:hypothetical protein GGS26DRAFT_199369 [Hypomontagnella submonticulosa]|nr:hypothetical protein GGS26DRAFT_199369 [Hypomontagnella submonticulosa]